MPIIVGGGGSPTEVVSSDTLVTVRLHTAWASVLLWHTLTGPVSIMRDGVVVATIPDGQGYWYDHFPALGSPSSYTVTNGVTTSTAATITVPSDAKKRTWIKSAVNPNWSLALPCQPLDQIDRENNVGLFPIDGDPAHPYAVFDDLGPRVFASTVKLTTAAQKDNLEKMIGAGPVYWQPASVMQETPVWAVVTRISRRAVRAGLAPIFTDASLAITETGAPTMPSRVIIPGWSWAEVQAMYATWTAEMGDNTSWLALIQRGVF